MDVWQVQAAVMMQPMTIIPTTPDVNTLKASATSMWLMPEDAWTDISVKTTQPDCADHLRAYAIPLGQHTIAFRGQEDVLHLCIRKPTS
jgi:hypothetical protein